MASIELTDLTKRFDDVTAVDGIDLEARDGEFLVVVGPSGCGKSTTLRCIAGLESPTAGTVRIGDEDVTAQEPHERDIAMVFQNYALYPHMTAERNMTFGMRSATDFSSAEIDRRVAQAAATLGIDDLLDRKPSALSGGEQQRVALGRAIVRDPAVFLMDEPLSNLDAKLRVQMRTELSRLHEELGTTTVYVTHDQTEAMTLGDRVVVMNDGRIQQVDTPQELYDYPSNRFVAEFIGDPAMNMLEVTLEAGSSDPIVRHEAFTIEVPNAPETEALDGGRAVLGFRPEDASIADRGTSPTGSVPDRRRTGRGDSERTTGPIEATVQVTEPLGDTLLCYCRAGDDEFKVQTAPRTGRAAGDAVTLTLDADRLHLFDLETGEAIYHSDTDRERRAATPEP
ncbi:carbohydrate ABC transporter ATP-binding protein, CUT1 family [Halobiforma haloterrestris]|uniref:ABC-type D-xylose/L-arabinose transporter n=1 Tax=Natronobacterium haloterrestre TaxID=148448 RepID=A0A1I1K1J5_NATHA|nr:ABC transporter ATP-binding protein [Halobiforma haloterrestris]SFC54616.1 carbohydrate ABC transporter ATP-binding protein, CUT1 family [Halobiforma haloterrestris]